MPVLDGHGATRQLRKAGYSRPMVALTAHAMIEEREKCMVSGYSEFLSKPIVHSQLIALVAKYKPTEKN